MKTVKMTVKTVMNIIILSFGKWGSAKSPILAVPAVSTVDKQAIEVTCNETMHIMCRLLHLLHLPRTTSKTRRIVLGVLKVDISQ